MRYIVRKCMVHGLECWKAERWDLSTEKASLVDSATFMSEQAARAWCLNQSANSVERY